MTKPILFLKRDITTGKWKEWECQAYVVQELRRRGFMVEGDQNAARRGFGAAAKAKATGMTAGTPDLRVLLPKGRIVFIELKMVKGKLSDSQKEWRAKAELLGFEVGTVFANCPRDMLACVETVLTRLTRTLVVR